MHLITNYVGKPWINSRKDLKNITSWVGPASAVCATIAPHTVILTQPDAKPQMRW